MAPTTGVQRPGLATIRQETRHEVIETKRLYKRDSLLRETVDLGTRHRRAGDFLSRLGFNLTKERDRMKFTEAVGDFIRQEVEVNPTVEKYREVETLLAAVAVRKEFPDLLGPVLAAIEDWAKSSVSAAWRAEHMLDVLLDSVFPPRLNKYGEEVEYDERTKAKASRAVVRKSQR